MEYVHVDKIISLVGNGCTKPMNGILSNSEYVIIKMLNNVEGNLVLANEYICYRLAKILDLPIPDAGISVIDANTEVADGIAINEENYGLCFYSLRVNKVTVVNQGIMKLISNKYDFLKVLLFDHLIYNKDRNWGNLLVSTMKNNHRFYIIDHTHVFKNESIWDRLSLSQGMNSNDYRDTIILEQNKFVYDHFFESISITLEDLNEVADELNRVITKDIIENIINEIPREWDFSEQNFKTLVDYLLYRLNNSHNICNLIIESLRR